MDFQPLDRFLKHLNRDIGIPTGDCIVYYKHKEVYRGSEGRQRPDTDEPLRRDATYNLYSCSKPITATAAMQLFEKGRFLLNDPLYDYIPEFRDMQVAVKDKETGEISYRPAVRPILVRDLFTMTTGFDYNLKTPEILQVIEQRGQEGKHATTLDIARAIAKGPLSRDPGTTWKYSVSHDLLASLVEVVSGQRFRDYVKENIFDPLGMKDSSYHPTREQMSRMAAIYRFDNELGYARQIPHDNNYRITPEYDSGGAGMIGTVDDYILFADAMSGKGRAPGGERILSSASVDLMRTCALSADQLRTMTWGQLRGYGYGLGVRTMIDPIGGGSLSTKGEFGWCGAAGSYVLIDPDRELAVFYAQHMLNNKEPYVHPRLRNIVYACLND